MSRLLLVVLLFVFARPSAWLAPRRARPDEDAWREAYAAEKQRFELLVEQMGEEQELPEACALATLDAVGPRMSADDLRI